MVPDASITASPLTISRGFSSGRRAFLLVLGVASGGAALIYEIVWFQMLQLVIGSSAVSLAVLLGTFMGGMCLGSLLVPRLLARIRRPLRLYAALEIAIAAAGILLLLALPLLERGYIGWAGHALPGVAARALLCATCLLPPTLCMGATLPVIAHAMEADDRGVVWVGYFYGANTLGAVAGTLLAGFYLLRLHDSYIATGAAVAANAFAAIGAWLIATDIYSRPADNRRAAVENAVPGAGGAAAVWWVLALSGAAALGAEVIWTRLLSLMLGGTVYTFSIILAVFLAGLGAGGHAGAWLAGHVRRPLLALGGCQAAQALAILVAATLIARVLPYWHIEQTAEVRPLVKFGWDIARAACAVFVPALFWGATFPLALAATGPAAGSPARRVAGNYAANTLGAIVGALAMSLWLVPAIGTQQAQRLLILLSLVAALIAWARSDGWRWPVLALVIAAGAFAIVRVPAIPWQLVAYGREILWPEQAENILFLGEGKNSSVAVSRSDDGARYFHTSGKTEASSLAKDMRLQRMLGHLPALLHENPRSVLVVGCGAGVTAGSFVPYPSIQRIVICEIEPMIPRFVAPWFKLENYNVVHDPRVEIVNDDARHYLATTREKFDIITSDPIHPWVKGAAVLYTQEYFTLCREHLNPGGICTQWVPFYESSRAAVQSELATFFSIFPEGTLWGNDDEGRGYDTVVFGRVGPLHVDLDALQRRLERPDFLGVRDSLSEVGLGSSFTLMSAYAGRATELKPWLAHAELNRDRNLRLQYLAGNDLNSREGESVYVELVRQRTFPADIFPGSGVRAYVLRDTLERHTDADGAVK